MDYTKEKTRIDKLRGHELFPQKLLAEMPELYKTEHKGKLAVARIKLFHPLSNWYWYFSEFDGIELFFGLTIGFESEFGYSSRSEFELGVIRGLPFERDLYFEPMSFQDVVAHHRKLEPDRRYPNLD